MAEVQPSTSRGEDTFELVGEASRNGADGSTYPESVPSVTAAESPSFLTWMWIQILTACSGVRGARGGGLSGAQHSLVDSDSEVSSRIAASKSTWSEVPAHSIDHSIPVPRPNEELSVWEELKASAPDFFRDDWTEEVKLGRMIGEGGQAQIFEVEGFEHQLVVKVFKLDAEFSLADLKRHWPRKGGGESSSTQERSSGFVFADPVSNVRGSRCYIALATLLKDGRFAFLMQRYWLDLRSLIDLKVEDKIHPWEFDLLFTSGRHQPPFLFRDSIQVMEHIAMGMQGLHAEGVLHRDLKAANVLLGAGVTHGVICNVADYECAMFVQGTGFWRAPEVLQELLKNAEDRSAEIWTEKVDVYSFGMTCYEILTGQIPFGGCNKSKWGDVIRGERPSLPNYLFPRLRELVEACWHVQPSQRPCFEVILEELRSLFNEHITWN